MISPAGGVLAAVVGAVVGSFVTTAALRGAEGGFALRGRSACAACGARLGGLEMAPVFAFAALGGRCGHCRAVIPIAHPVGEVAAAAAAVAIAALWPVEAWVPGFLMVAVLLFLAVYDAHRLRLPDPGTALAGLLATLLAGLDGRLGLSLASGAATLLGLLGVRAGYERWRGHPGLGLGDVKLMAGLAIWTGPIVAPWAVVGAAGLALAWGWVARLGGTAEARAPFGPFLALVFGAAGIWVMRR
jgi:leader peptidase (prepilin peptidase)/N-methyltransferase